VCCYFPSVCAFYRGSRRDEGARCIGLVQYQHHFTSTMYIQADTMRRAQGPRIDIGASI